MNKKSNKQRAIDAAYKVEKIRYLLNHEPCCYCCGTYQGYIDFSHLVPRSYNRSLVANYDNFVLKCRKHHKEWEANNKLMPKYEELMERVRILDESYYNLRQ
jgi:5-methylcytosine-specific restriction endonuclease McrA